MSEELSIEKDDKGINFYDKDENGFLEVGIWVDADIKKERPFHSVNHLNINQQDAIEIIKHLKEQFEL